MQANPTNGMTLWPIFIAVALLIFGVVLLVIAWRGKKIDDHPVCRKCKFDLFGSPFAESCPECGATLTTPNAKMIGNRKRRSWFVFVATILLVIGVVGTGATSWAYANQTDWQKYKPVWLLRSEAKQHGTPASWGALDEMRYRLIAGKLSQPQIDAVVADALKIQADQNITWEPLWGKFVEAVYDAGSLSQPDLERYLQNMIEHTFSLKVRPRIRRGDVVSYRILDQGRRGSEDHKFWIDNQENEFLISRDVVKRRIGGIGASSSSNSGGSMSSALKVDDVYWHEVVDGKHIAEIHLHTSFKDDTTKRVVYKTKLILSGSFELLPKDQPTIRPASDPKLSLAMKNSLQNLRLKMSQSQIPNQLMRLRGTIDIKSPPAGLAFDVFVRDQSGREWDMSSISAAAQHNMGYGISNWEIENFTAYTVDVVFRPSEDVAKCTIDVFEYWNEEIIIEDVPVDWSGVPENLRPPK